MPPPAGRGSTEPPCFIDHDGRVYLVRDGDRFRLPIQDEVPFAFAVKRRLSVMGQAVVLGGPEEKHAREDWVWKDALPSLQGVDPLVRAVANATMARLVAKGAFTRGAHGRAEQVLLVKPTVGFYTGKWSLPGGYVDYGESPEECLVREVQEELGVRGHVVRLLKLDSQVVPSGVHFVSFLYEGRLHSDDFALKEDEIEDARWFGLDAALREVGSSLGAEGLESLRKEAQSP